MPRIALLLLAALAPLVSADAPATNHPTAAPSDLRTAMTLRGTLILDETFTPDSWKAHWSTYKSDCALIDGHLRVNAPPDAGHPAEANVHEPLHNTVIQFRFRCAGAA